MEKLVFVVILICLFMAFIFYLRFLKKRKERYYYFEFQIQWDRIYPNTNYKGELYVSLFRNSNKLYFEPVVNSNGVSGRQILPDDVRHNLTEQFWIDLSKYKKGCDAKVDYWIENILPTLGE
jgi:hypothetical protein